MFAVTSLLECLTPKNNTNITSVRNVLFQHCSGWSHHLAPPFDIDVYLRTEPSVRFSCTVQLSETSCASPRWTRSSFAIVSARTAETRRERPFLLKSSHLRNERNICGPQQISMHSTNLTNVTVQYLMWQYCGFELQLCAACSARETIALLRLSR